MIDVENIVEEWKDAVGYEGYYQVSNLGRVKSIKRVIIQNNKVEYPVEERILKPIKHSRGYVRVGLRNGGKNKKVYIHRLVAIAFIDRLDETFEVNHKDENKINNTVDNLEWVSHEDNINYGTRTERSMISRSKHIVQSNLNGDVIKVWTSGIDIERTLGFHCQNISNVCSGKNKTAYGFRWKFI